MFVHKIVKKLYKLKSLFVKKNQRNRTQYSITYVEALDLELKQKLNDNRTKWIFKAVRHRVDPAVDNEQPTKNNKHQFGYVCIVHIRSSHTNRHLTKRKMVLVDCGKMKTRKTEKMWFGWRWKTASCRDQNDQRFKMFRNPNEMNSQMNAQHPADRENARTFTHTHTCFESWKTLNIEHWTFHPL